MNVIDGAMIKNRREEMGISMRELARLADISPSYLSRIENGIKTDPSKYVIKRIMTSLEIDREIEEVDEHYVVSEMNALYGRKEEVEKKLKELNQTLREYNKRGGMDVEEMTEIMEMVKEIVKT